MRITQALMAPVHVAALATGAKSFADNPIIGSERLNKAGLHARRVALAHQMADARRARLAHLVSDADRAAFERDGYILRRDFLPADAFKALRHEVENLVAPAREMLQGDTVTRRMPLDPAVLARSPHIATLLASKEWSGLMRYVASYDMEPVYYIQSILSHVKPAPPDPQTALHADTFQPNLKAWFFLHDVAEDEGPFVYVPGSHKASRRRLAWEKQMSLAKNRDKLSGRGSLRVRDGDLKRLGLRDPVAFAVPANSLVVGDTYGFHARGPSVRPSTRIEIWAYARRNPFLPWLGMDPWSVPPLKGRKPNIVWAASDAMAKLGLGGHAWHDVGELKPGDPPRYLGKPDV